MVSPQTPHPRPALLFSVTLFASAALLFCVQPMVGRLLLPMLGGSPQVWNTCLVFFQAALLLGYALAHLLSSRIAPRHQASAHMACVLLPVLLLPIAIEGPAPSGAEVGPTSWVLATLALSVGAPFVALAMNGPLLQRWYSFTDAADADDPYFLYAASNLGSFIGLLGYPLLVEPNLGALAQTRAWAWGYGGLSVLIAATGWRMKGLAKQRQAAADSTAAEPLSAARQLRWTALAAIPSSLLLGLTTFLTTDLAAIPLLWVIPLALYLLTWVATFASRPLVPMAFTARALPILVVAWLLLHVSEATEPVWALVLFHLLTFVAAAMLCHGRLAEDRPAAGHLTRFFLLTSLGGVLGGSFNALLAPHVFADLWEYPIAIVAACFALPLAQSWSWRDVAWPCAVAALAGVLTWIMTATQVPAGAPRTLLIFGVPALAAWLLADRPQRFAVAVALLLLVAPLAPSVTGAVARVERSFFGVQRVTVDSSGRFDQIVHGHTLHGRQWRTGPRRCEPLAYYHRSGPLGDILEAAGERLSNVAMIGVGAGSMASAQPRGSRWFIVDIDPATWTLARDHFTFLGACSPQGRREEVLADGRVALATLPPQQRFDLVVIDVFSSDAIPVHMLTREALGIYVDRLREGGMLAVHASNRYLDVVSVLAALAGDAGLVTRFRDDRKVAGRPPGSEPSRWVVIGRDEVALGQLASDPRWCAPKAHDRVWTDDFNDLPRLFAQYFAHDPSHSDSCRDAGQTVP